MSARPVVRVNRAPGRWTPQPRGFHGAPLSYPDKRAESLFQCYYCTVGMADADGFLVISKVLPEGASASANASASSAGPFQFLCCRSCKETTLSSQ